jgi:hypothetical protein
MPPSVPPPSRRAHLLLLAALPLLLAVAALLPPAPRAVVAQGEPDATPTIMPTFEPWTPRATWVAIHSPERDGLWTGVRGATPPAMRAVHGVPLPGGGHEVWTVGDHCSVAVHRGDGWQRVSELESACAGQQTFDLRDVFVVGPNDLWAVGRYEGGPGLERDCVIEEPADRDDVDFEEGCGMIVRYDGADWRIMNHSAIGQPRPLPALNALDMKYAPEQEAWIGWIAGNDAAFDSLKAMILEFLDDGKGPNGEGRWRYTSTTRSTNITADLRAAKIISADEAWIVGEHGHEAWYRTANGQPGDWGARGKSGKDHLYAMDMTDQLYGWDGGQKGRMNRYIGFCHDDDPETACWFDNKDRPIRPPSGPPLTVDVWSIDLLRRGVGWVVGGQTSASSTIAFLQPDEKWYTVPVEGDPVVALYDVWMLDDDLGWAVGEEGTILEYRVDPDAAPATGTATLPPTHTATPLPTGVASPTATSASGSATATAGPAASPTAVASATPPLGATPTTAPPSPTPGATLSATLPPPTAGPTHTAAPSTTPIGSTPEVTPSTAPPSATPDTMATAAATATPTPSTPITRRIYLAFALRGR